MRKTVNRTALPLLATILALLVAPHAAWSQRKEGPPKPQTLDLMTKDGVRLKATYYGQKAGPEGKKAVPIVLLHDYKGHRNTYSKLAGKLQESGHAVVAVDLRGHGDSTRANILGRERELDASKLQTRDFVRMFQYDMETVKSFLRERNNAEELNLNALCVVGAEMGAVVALNWAAFDWSWPILTTGKQGQDVKALVLISPPMNFKGVATKQPLAHPAVRTRLSMAIFVGDGDASSHRNAERMYKQIKKLRDDSRRDSRQPPSVFFTALPTSLQGGKLVSENEDLMAEMIQKFVQWRLVELDFPWSQRTAVLQ